MQCIISVVDDFLIAVLNDISIKSRHPTDKYCPSLHDKEFAIFLSLGEIRAKSQVYVSALKQFGSSCPGDRTPEHIRCATANFVRSVESFKQVFSHLYPESGAYSHPLVGCLYGYEKCRTATLDKAALIAQEKVLSLWHLDSAELAAMNIVADDAEASIAQSIDTFCARLIQEAPQAQMA